MMQILRFADDIVVLADERKELDDGIFIHYVLFRNYKMKVNKKVMVSIKGAKEHIWIKTLIPEKLMWLKNFVFIIFCYFIIYWRKQDKKG